MPAFNALLLKELIALSKKQNFEYVSWTTKILFSHDENKKLLVELLVEHDIRFKVDYEHIIIYF
jgi:hypothetical protein